MKRRSLGSLCIILVLAFSAPSIALADHLSNAISHTRAAIEGGKKGDTAALVAHAKAALKAATTIYASTVASFSSKDADAKAQLNAQLKESLVNLRAAVAEGKKKHAEAATQLAEEALTQLEAAPH
jgi:hypothetical protein